MVTPSGRALRALRQYGRTFSPAKAEFLVDDVDIGSGTDGAYHLNAANRLRSAKRAARRDASGHRRLLGKVIDNHPHPERMLDQFEQRFAGQ